MRHNASGTDAHSWRAVKAAVLTGAAVELRAREMGQGLASPQDSFSGGTLHGVVALSAVSTPVVVGLKIGRGVGRKHARWVGITNGGGEEELIGVGPNAVVPTEQDWQTIPIQASSTSKGGEFNPMKVALPPTCDDHGTGVHADDQSQSRTVKDEERYSMHAPLPPYDNVDDDVDKLVQRRTMRARVFLALGLALEASSTLWAFQQARSAGALAGPSNCHHLGLLYTYSRVVDKCVGPIDAEAIDHFSEALNESSLQASLMEGLLVCDYLPDAHAGATTFWEICPACDENRSHYVEPCSWVALSDPSDGICSPHYVSTNTSDGAITEAWPIFYPLSCRPQQPSGSAAITIAALAVALSSQLLEAFVGFKYWRETEQKKTAPTLAASIFETFGVIVVSSMLIKFPDTSLIIAWSELSIIALVVVGALAEITGECSDRAARRFPYLGAVGNGLIWLCAALNEVILIIYFRYADTLIRDFPSLAREVGGLFAVELLGLVAMWIARGLWTKAKLLRASLKRSKGPLRKRDNSSHF